jgi:hypothetical protein
MVVAGIRSTPLPFFGVAMARQTRLEEPYGASLGNQASTLFAEDSGSKKGLAMLIRRRLAGVEGGAATPAAPDAISLSSLPTLPLSQPSIGGLLLLIGP